MTNRLIYSSALSRLGSGFDDEQKEAFESRVPFLISAFCTESAELDQAYREANGLEAAPEFDAVCVHLDGDFPRSERFSSAAAFYVAAMLVIDDDLELSDRLFDNYCDCMARIQSEIPTKLERIAQKYL